MLSNWGEEVRCDSSKPQRGKVIDTAFLSSDFPSLPFRVALPALHKATGREWERWPFFGTGVYTNKSLFKNCTIELGSGGHVFSSSTQEAEAGGSL